MVRGVGTQGRTVQNSEFRNQKPELQNRWKENDLAGTMDEERWTSQREVKQPKVDGRVWKQEVRRIGVKDRVTWWGYSGNRICSILHIPPMVEIRPNSSILNLLSSLFVSTPPMPPPQLAPRQCRTLWGRQ